MKPAPGSLHVLVYGHPILRGEQTLTDKQQNKNCNYTYSYYITEKKLQNPWHAQNLVKTVRLAIKTISMTHTVNQLLFTMTFFIGYIILWAKPMFIN